jgi:hypothetical protein
VEVVLEDIAVMYVVAEGGPAGAQKAFTKLESKLKTLRGRRFYGTYHAGEYRACVAIRPDDKPDDLGLDTWIITGGKYIREKMLNWAQRIPEIGETFMRLSEQYPADPTRPSVEYYRSQTELQLLLPLLEQ